MNTENHTSSSQNNEVSLGNVGARIKNFSRSIYDTFSSTLSFLIKNKKKLLPVVLIGFVIGAIVDFTSKKTYSNEIVVAANFGASEYLYSSLKNYKSFKINAKSKKEQKLYSKISDIEITPVKNAYDFLVEHTNNIYLFQVLSERNIDLEKYFESKMMEKNFRYHKITFNTTVPKDSTRFLVDFLIQSLNKNPYFKERMEVEKQNLLTKKIELERSVAQINNFFDRIGEVKSGTSNTIVFNDFSNLDNLVDRKKRLLEQIDIYNIYLLEGEHPIYEAYASLNNQIFRIPKFIIYPFLLLLLASVMIRLGIGFKQRK